MPDSIESRDIDFASLNNFHILDLDDDCLIVILRQFSFVTVMRLRQVCVRWKLLIDASVSHLFNSLSEVFIFDGMEQEFKYLSYEQTKSFLVQFHSHLETFRFHEIVKWGQREELLVDQKLLDLLWAAPRLKHIEISCNFVKSNRLQRNPKAAQQLESLKLFDLSTFEESVTPSISPPLELGVFASLTRLSLQGCLRFHPVHMSLSDMCPQLRRLHINPWVLSVPLLCGHYANLQVFKMKGYGFDTFVLEGLDWDAFKGIVAPI
ncbi:f-box domain-containing protein [Ditylenchus destructor]|nr:f-box domain-containing protein [Ditylenchus destructor]